VNDEHTYVFLSDEWMTEVSRLKAVANGGPVPRPALVVNATITGVPFGTGTLALHCSHSPILGWLPGHVSAAAFQITLDYHVAKALILDPSVDISVFDQAAQAGTLSVTGDPHELRRWFTTGSADPSIASLEAAVRAMTR
jgi:hypothetical protein